jgi:hypothetical protein
MPEIPLCIYCRKSVDLDVQDYVITNKNETDDRREWEYAHLNCHDEAMETKEDKG